MPFPIQRTFKITPQHRCEMFWPENAAKRSQDLEEAYQDAGQFYWTNLSVKSDEITFGKDSIPIILPRYLYPNTDTNTFRLTHGEGDNLPGLIIDIYGDTAVMQCHSVGMYLSRHLIAEQLIDVFGGYIKSVYDKSSGTLPMRERYNPVDGFIAGKGNLSGVYNEYGNKFWVS